MNHCDTVEFKWPLRAYRDYLVRQVQANPDIMVHMNCAPVAEWLEAEGFEVVIAAVGSEPALPPIPGADAPFVKFGKDVFGHESELGARVVIVGGGEIGVECGIQLARKGHRVTVLEMTDKLAREADHNHYYSMVQAAWEREENFTGIVGATCTKIEAHQVTYRDGQGSLHSIPCDSVVLSAGMRAKTEEALSYAGAGQLFRMVGDCKKAASLQQALRSAWTTAKTI